MSDPTIKAGLALLIVIVVSAIAFFLVARLRDYTAQDWDSPPETLSNFEEMRLKGDISEEEFRTIQAAASTSDEEETSEPIESHHDGNLPEDDDPLDEDTPSSD